MGHRSGRASFEEGKIGVRAVWRGFYVGDVCIRDVAAMKRPKRKAIPTSVKCEVIRRQRSNCTECKQPLWPSDPTEYDHRPSLILRPVNADGTDYVPPQNDPDHIEALHASCHQKRTTGRKPGASKTATTLGSDIWLKTKFDRLEGRTKPKRKAPIKSRGFAKGPKRKVPWPKRKMR